MAIFVFLNSTQFKGTYSTAATCVQVQCIECAKIEKQKLYRVCIEPTTNMSKEKQSPESNPEFNLESFAAEAAEKAVAKS